MFLAIGLECLGALHLGQHLGRLDIGQTLLENVRVCSLVKGGTGVFGRWFIFEAMFNVSD